MTPCQTVFSIVEQVTQIVMLNTCNIGLEAYFLLTLGVRVAIAYPMSNKPWILENINAFVSNLAIAQGYRIIDITQKIDHSLPSTELSRWMDTVDGHTGGWNHRVAHGHDFAANVSDVFEKFGAEGVAKYPLELLRDATTPHGIPFPGTELIVKSGSVSAKAATEWMSMNVADIFSGGIAIYSTVKLWKKTKSGNLDDSSIMWAAMGVGVKVTAGVVTTSPILILSGVADAGILISDLKQAKQAFEKFCDIALSDEAISSYLGLAAGGGAIVAATAAMTTFGVASTGTAITGLSGAAATNAMLAAFGGGSLAVGGLGMAGGLTVLSGGTGLIGVCSGYAIYQYVKRKKTA